MKEFIALVIFTVTPPILLLVTWWFISWEIDWCTELRGLMVVFGFLGFLLGVNVINEIMHGT